MPVYREQSARCAVAAAGKLIHIYLQKQSGTPVSSFCQSASSLRLLQQFTSLHDVLRQSVYCLSVKIMRSHTNERSDGRIECQQTLHEAQRTVFLLNTKLISAFRLRPLAACCAWPKTLVLCANMSVCMPGHQARIAVRAAAGRGLYLEGDAALCPYDA